QAERVVHARTFECLAARRPLLAIAPRGDLWDVIDGQPATILKRPSDTAGVVSALVELITQHIERGRVPCVEREISMYAHRELPGGWGGLLGVLASDRRPRLQEAWQTATAPALRDGP